MADSNGPDWGLIGGTIATVATVLATVIAGARGAFRDQRTDRQKETDREDALQAAREKASVDHSAMTLDGVFRLVNELQDEVTRRGTENVELERRCGARVQLLEQRINAQDTLIAKQETTIATLERQVRDLERRPE